MFGIRPLTAGQIWNCFLGSWLFVIPSYHLAGQVIEEHKEGFADKPCIVIVHGAWGGRHQWKVVAEQLEEATRLSVYRASLTGLGERAHLASRKVNLDTHIEDVKKLITCEQLHNVILIGHSYGGMVISGVAHAIPEKISRLLFLDAYLPDHGESFFSQHPEMRSKLVNRANEAGEGWKIPVDWPNPMGDVPHPLATLTQTIELDVARLNKIPSQYWLFTDGGPKENDKLMCFFERARTRNYTTKTFTWGHNPHRNHIDEFTTALREYVQSVNKR